MRRAVLPEQFSAAVALLPLAKNRFTKKSLQVTTFRLATNIYICFCCNWLSVSQAVLVSNSAKLSGPAQKSLLYEVGSLGRALQSTNFVFTLLRYVRQSSAVFGERRGYSEKNKKEKKRDRITCASVVVIGVVTLAPPTGRD